MGRIQRSILPDLRPMTSPWPCVRVIGRNPPRVQIAKAAIAGEDMRTAGFNREILAVFVCGAVAIIEDRTPWTFFGLQRARLEQHRNERNADNQ